MAEDKSTSNESDEQFLVYKYPKRSDKVSSGTGIKLFSKQKDAIKYALSENVLRVFAFEISQFCRRFLVANVKEFWEKYKIEGEKNFYEVLVCGEPVRLFLDLEYTKSINQDKEGDNMTLSLISLFKNHLQNIFNISDASQNVIILDSSNHQKFSQHVTFPTVQFKNIKQCGDFVYQVLSAISDNDRGIFEVKSEKGDPVKLFVDESVYTNNRHVRIYLSSKFGQSRPLLCLSKSEKFPGRSEEEQGTEVNSANSEKSEHRALHMQTE